MGMSDLDREGREIMAGTQIIYSQSISAEPQKFYMG